MIIIILLGSAYTFLQIWFDDVCSLRMVQSAGIASSKVISEFSKLILLSVTHHLRLFSLFILIYSKSSTSIIISYHLLLVFKVMKKVSFGGERSSVPFQINVMLIPLSCSQMQQIFPVRKNNGDWYTYP